MSAWIASTGLHHITAIAGPAQENLDFYAGVLGMRLVKRSVNQDDPGTYHLFYADAEGHPGSDLTFFPWAQMAPPRAGSRACDGGRPRSARRTAWPTGANGSSATARASRARSNASARSCSRSPIRTGCSVALVEAGTGAAVRAVARRSRSRRAADPRPVQRAALGARRRRRRPRF